MNQEISNEALQNTWKKFILKLRSENKSSAAGSLELAEIKFSDKCITLITFNTIQQRFAETEKLSLNEFLQTELNNRAFGLLVVKIENQDDKEPTERVLSSREIYQQMLQQYPVLKELKDRLGLELDY